MSRSFTGPLQTYKNIQRLNQILNVFLKYGFGHIIQQIELIPAVSSTQRILGRFSHKKQEPATPQTLAERLRMAFEELGPAFIKLGQMMSTRPDLLPKEIVEELRRLQDDVRPEPFAEIKAVIEAELGVPLNEAFSSVNPIATASASIAQVHFAQLLGGQDVVLKVQRPNLENIILADINLLFFIAEKIEQFIPESQNYQPVLLVEEFSRSIRRELDFIQEASNTEQFNKIFATNPHIVAPRVYWELSSRKVLTLQRFRGVPINRFDELDRRGIDRKQLAEEATKIFFVEVFDHGFFHADPHPGNVFALDDGRIGLIDFGLVGRLDQQMRRHLVTITFAIISRDYERLVREFINMGILDEDVNIRAVKRDMMEIVEPYYGKPIKYIEISPILQNVLDATQRYQAKVQPELMSLVRTLVIVEGVGRELYPDLDLLSLSTPFIGKMLRERYGPRTLGKEALKVGADIIDLGRVFPDQARLILRKLLYNQLEIRQNIKGFDALVHNLDRVGNRLALSLIISSLIIGSTFLLNSNLPPIVAGYPLFGLLGFTAAAVLGVYLAVLILRAGKY